MAQAGIAARKMVQRVLLSLQRLGAAWGAVLPRGECVRVGAAVLDAVSARLCGVPAPFLLYLVSLRLVVSFTAPNLTQTCVVRRPPSCFVWHPSGLVVSFTPEPTPHTYMHGAPSCCFVWCLGGWLSALQPQISHVNADWIYVYRAFVARVCE